MLGEPDPLTPPAASGRSLRLLGAAAVATVVVGFVVGFAIGGRGSDRGGDAVTAAGSVPPSTASVTTTSTAAPATTEPEATSSTTASSTSTTAPTPSTEAVTTVAPTTTAVVPFPTVATSAVPVTTVPPTYAPSRVIVSYGSDAGGRLVLPRNGSATLVITNEGGLAQQWLVTGTGFTTVGTTQGNLGPGQTVTVTIVAPSAELPSGEVTGVISVLGAVNPTITFVIPPA